MYIYLINTGREKFYYFFIIQRLNFQSWVVTRALGFRNASRSFQMARYYIKNTLKV